MGWYRRNLPIAVPVTIIVGGLILAALYSCIANCCRTKRPPPVARNRARSSGYPGQPPRQSARNSARQSRTPNPIVYTNEATSNLHPNAPQWNPSNVEPTAPVYARTAPDAVYNPEFARVDSQLMVESYPLQPLQTRHTGPIQDTVRRDERDLPEPPRDTSHWVDPRAYNGFG